MIKGDSMLKLGKAKKIGKVKRSKDSICWVDAQGNVWERKIVRGRKRTRSKGKRKKRS